LFSSVPSGQTWGIILYSVTLYPSLFFIQLISFDTTRLLTSAITECHDKLTVILLTVRSRTVPRTACLHFTRCIQVVDGTRCSLILSSHLAWVGTCLLVAD
jgi:hypothetical protein